MTYTSGGLPARQGFSDYDQDLCKYRVPLDAWCLLQWVPKKLKNMTTIIFTIVAPFVGQNLTGLHNADTQNGFSGMPLPFK